MNVVMCVIFVKVFFMGGRETQVCTGTLNSYQDV